MKAISILQPWAWSIAHGFKPVENRTWRTRYRGPVLIHAGKRWGREQKIDLAFVRATFPEIALPETFELGGIIGVATITDCVTTMDSPWFFGPYGFVMRDQRAFKSIIPFKGALGFFDVPDDLVREHLE